MSGVDPAETFRQEAQELLDQLEHALLDLEHSPGDAELIGSAFRALHTIKGSGSMFGFERAAGFTHHVENAFDRVRKGIVAPTAELISLALVAKDHIRLLIEAPDSADPEAEAVILRGLSDIMRPAVVMVPQLDPGLQSWRVHFRLPAGAMTAGTNPLLLLDELRGLGRVTVVAQTGEIPELEDLDPGESYIGWDVVLSTAESRDAIEQVFMFIMDDMDLSITTIPQGTEARRLGEILIDRGEVAPAAVAAALSVQQQTGAGGETKENKERLGALLIKQGKVSEEGVASALAEQQHVRAEARASKGVDSIRVPAERLDELMERVGELVIAQSRLKEIVARSSDPLVQSVAEEIERLALELRDTTMNVRMIPIGSLFSRFRRLVHDLSRDLGKEIALNTIGEETELDKTVIERLNDPLVHLIRNAVDHGLERPDERVAAGKPRQGRITLSAEHAGGEVLITITDDGHGLDRERIRARAEEQGLIAAGAKISDNDLFAVLFEPGFSTVREVTNLSGRGVGMDVVKRTIMALRGTVDITSTPGQGTRIILRLPLTLAIIDGLLVRVGQGRYVIPLSAVEECVELQPDDDRRSRGRSFLNIRGELVPFLRLREMFKVATPPDRFPKVVIVSSGDMRVGMVVDQVIGDHQTVIKSLSKLHADVKTFSGATILGDGTVALILDVIHLVGFGQELEKQFKIAG